MTVGEPFAEQIMMNGPGRSIESRDAKNLKAAVTGGTNQKDPIEARSGLDERSVDRDDLLEEKAIECAAEGYVLKHQLEVAIDDHLKLQRQNEILRSRNDEWDFEQENNQLTLQNKKLFEQLQETKKEIHACKSILEILEKEKRQEMEIHQVVDLTNMADRQ